MVLEEVGNISEAMRLADDDAGEAKRKAIMTTASFQPKESIWLLMMDNIAAEPSEYMQEYR